MTGHIKVENIIPKVLPKKMDEMNNVIKTYIDELRKNKQHVYITSRYFQLIQKLLVYRQWSRMLLSYPKLILFLTTTNGKHDATSKVNSLIDKSQQS